MAALTAAQAELISSLSQDDIPIKLRCATCSRLAVNAFRLPCCDQSICETCQSALPSTCPVCEHSPVASEDCKPHKSLRTTIKVFLRTEEKKREGLRLKEAKDTPPDTPVEPPAASASVPAPLDSAPSAEDSATEEAKAEPTPAADIAETPAQSLEDVESLQEAQQDIPQPSIEEIAPGQEQTLDNDANKAEDSVVGNDEPQNDAPEGDTNGEAAEGPSQPSANGFGFDSNAAAGFPGGMSLGGDMNQMQMMMAMQNGMQNGMAPNAFGNFPMMGMPGMNMDPMIMQSMFMNGGFGAGMGMNGMNMGGMGMGGFDGGVNGGFNNGWNGQQSWNVGPDNFNHPNAAGMGSGDYGASNSGYTPHAAGYNQGNYGRGNHYNDFQNNNFGYRGRGRGRGGYGRGGYGYGSHDTSQQYQHQYGAGNQINGQNSETGSVPTGPKADATPADNVDEFGREIRPTTDATEQENSDKAADAKEEPVEVAANDGDENEANEDQPPMNPQAEAIEPSLPQPIQTLDEVEAPAAHNGYPNGYSNNQYSGRGGFYGARGGGFGAMQPPVKPVDVPINAPTGPKAMRQGLPNNGYSSLRGRGNSIAGSATPRVNGSTSVAPEPSEKGEQERERTRSPSRERSRSRSRERDRSRSRERHHRRHKHRSASLSEDEKETERRRQRRKERRRRREEEDDERVVEGGKGEDDDRPRSASPSDSKRSSHRSRRDRDKHRERERDSDREHRSHKHNSSHRTHRDDRSRSRDRDREHRHRHSRRGSEDVDSKTEQVETSFPPTPIEEEPPRGPSAVSNGTNRLEIKGASSRRKNAIEEVVIPTGPRSSRQQDQDSTSHRRREDEDRHRSSKHRDDKDKERERERERDRPKERTKPAATAPAVKNPHEEEREARNRERLMKEAQRMAGLSGLAAAGSRKRSRDDGEDSRRGKKKGRRSGVDETDEARIARLEAERESARW